ncbi:phosphatase PAP2 family protein [Planctomycetota bacterium]
MLIRPSLMSHILLITAIAIMGMLPGGCATTATQAKDVLTDDLLQLPGAMWEDSKQMVARPENIAILLVGGGASGYVRCAHDDEFDDHFKGHNYNTFGSDFTIGVGAAGNPVTHFALAGSSYMYGLLADDEHTRAVSGSLMEALALNGLLTLGLKGIAQDHCPNGESLAWPSGHTSSTVTLATVMNEYYGPWVGVPLYALSGFVMYERMETREHWASDLVFGAALGYVVGKTVAQQYKPQLFGMDVVPYINPENGSAGLALAKRF